MDTNTNTLFTWHAPAKIAHSRSEKWYMVGGIFCALLIVYGVITGAWSMAIIFGTIAGLYFLIRNEAHRDHSIVILMTGIDFDGKHYMWADFQEYWILQGPGYYELHISSNKYWRPDIVILVPERIDVLLVRDTLGEFLPQTSKQKEKILDAFIRFCKL